MWIRLLNIGKFKFCNKETVRYYVYKTPYLGEKIDLMNALPAKNWL